MSPINIACSHDLPGIMARHTNRQWSAFLFLLSLPMLLAPTHPIAVYGYLFDTIEQYVTPHVYAYDGVDLAGFLTSPAQVARYRSDLLEDMLDRRTGKMFVIVRCPDGTLQHEPIRTWNGFLPQGLPHVLCLWLDRKELPFLGDEVDTWLRGNEIIANGHYHPFGGGPSAGDIEAQRFSAVPEIVVSNGLVPMVYLQGEVVSYGEDVCLSEDIFRALRPLERSLMFDGTGRLSWSEEPSEALRSFLGYMRDYQEVDTSSRSEIARASLQLCLDFQDRYRAGFPSGFVSTPYANDPDKFNIVSDWGSVLLWSEINRWSSSDLDADVAEAKVS